MKRHTVFKLRVFKLRSLVVWWTLFTQLCTPVLAQPLVVDTKVTGAQPVVEVIQGVPIINIATPDTHGVSNNAFTHFNVGPAGVVLNNGAAQSQTQLVGPVGGNPLLNGNPAATILNQVTASNPSQLSGTLEVAGQRANVILANPAGITCSGCGFLNANRATLSTGRPQVGLDGSISFDVTSGTILINGAGLNASGNHQADLGQIDLIARSIQIKAGVWADHLNVVAGSNRVNYGSDQVTASNFGGQQPYVAVDTAALGGMYANSIRLIATGMGAGVNLSGHLAALTGDLKVNAAGEVKIAPSATLNAGGALDISTRASFSNMGAKLTAGGDLSVVTPYVLDNRRGTLSAGADVSLKAKTLFNEGGTITGQNVVITTEKISKTDLRHYPISIHNTGGLLQATEALTLNADRVINQDTRSTNLLRPLGLVGKSVTLNSDPQASLFDNTVGSVVATEQLVLQTERLQNGAGLISSLGSAHIESDLLHTSFHTIKPEHAQHSNTPGEVLAGDRLSINTVALQGWGALRSEGDLELTIKNDPKRAVSVLALIGLGPSFIDANFSKIKAGGDLTVSAISLRNVNGAELVSGGTTTLNVEKALINAAVIEGRDTRIKASQITNNPSGRIHATAGDVEVLGTDAIDLKGEIKAGQDVHISTPSDITLGGLVEASRDLSAVAGTKMTHTGQLVASGDQGSIQIRAPVIKTSGSATAVKDVTFTADELDLAGTTLSTAGTLMLHTVGDIHTRDATLQGTELDLRAKNLYNAGGKLTAQNNLTATLSGFLDNTGGTLSAGGDLTASAQDVLNNTNGTFLAGGTASLDATALHNAQGVIKAHSVSAKVLGPVLNTGGLIQATEALALTADKIDNADTRSEDLLRPLGLIGKNVALTSSEFDNTRGSVAAEDTLTLQAKNLSNAGGSMVARGDLSATLSGLLDNTGGTLSAGGDLTATAQEILNNTGLIQATGALRLSADQIKNRDTRSEDSSRPLGLIGKTVQLTSRVFDNTRGSVTAEERLTLDTQALDLTDGMLHSGGDLALTVKGDLDQAGALRSGRDMTVLVRGKLENAGPVSAGGDLTVNAVELTNTTSGELAARGAQTLKVGQVLTNMGVIDGGATHIEAAQVNNQGRLYGDKLAIRAKALINEEGPKGAPILASHGDMDLGVGTLTNRDHGLIYVGGNLRVGSDLDTDARAFGQASSLLNRSATIEVGGDATIAAASIQNENADYSSAVVLTSVTPKVYYRPEGTTDRYDRQTTWLCHLEVPDCSKDPGWLRGDLNQRLLLPSESYPESRYGPTFDYTARFTTAGIGGKTAPIKPFDIHPTKKLPNDLSGLIGDGQVIDDPAAQWSKIYPADVAVWKVFGVEPPSSLAPNLPKTRRLEEDPESVKDKEKALQAYNEYIAPVHELDRRIRSFNADFERRTVTNFTIDEVNETVRESRTLSTDPALILVNGDARFTGSVVNDKSQIVTGGKLSVDGPEIRNIGATGERRIEHEGTSTRTYEHKKKKSFAGISTGTISERRTEEPQPYRAVISVEPIELPVAVAMGGETGQAEQKDFILALQGKHQASTVHPEENAPYLIATDPRLVGQSKVVSSDLLLEQFPLEGSEDQPVVKRAFDGFGEQKVVSDQIRVATGQRFLPSFHDNDAQYRALLSAGAELARAEGLKIGEPLTPTQIRQLTTDRAWLVRQTVTLPDGTTQQVLVPKVYLKAPLSNTTLNPTTTTQPGGSTLLSGHDINLSASKDLTNTGTIGARDSSVLTAHTLVNEKGGRIQGNQVELTAREDLTNRAGTIKGESVALRAGRDVVLASTSEYDHQDDGRFSYWSRAISGVSRVDAGRLDVEADRDIALTSAHVTAREDGRFNAGRDITLDSLVEGQGRSAVYGPHNRMAVSTSSEVGTTLSTDHALTLLAGQDVRTRASDVTAGGALMVDAGRDIELTPGQTKSSAYDERNSKTSGLFSSKKTHSIYALDWTQTQGSTMTGDSVTFNAGRDVSVTGSTVGAQHDLTLKAKGNIAILSGTNTVEGLQYEQVKKSGFGTSGGLSYGQRDQLDSLESLRTEVVPSTLGSIRGNVQIQGSQTVAVKGSQVLAPKGSVTVMGQKITLDPAIELLREKEVHAITQGGLTLSGSTPVVSGFQVGQRMGQAVRQLGRPADNPVMIALAGLTTGLAAKNTYDALMKDPQHLGGASVMVSVGSSKHRSQTERESSTMHGSTLLAGQDLTLFAQGAGKDSDIVVTGSTLSGGQDVLLKAEGDLLLQAALNKASQQTKSKGHSASLGVGLSFGVQKSGLTGELGVSKTRGHADGQDVSWTPSTVTANRLLAIESGGDTTFRGAQGHAKQIVADVDGDLLLESLQDTSTYKGKQANMALSGSMSMTGQGSVSGNVGRQSMKSDFASVISQTGLFAGDGGFQIDVKDHTHLSGAVIKGSEQSIDKGVNQLLTGTLTTEDIQNRADYRASMLSVGGGMALGNGGRQPGTSDLGTTQDGQVAGGATKTHGTSLATSESGLGMNAPIVMLAKGSDQSTTYSAISDGTVVIRKGLAQRDLTGMMPSETLIALNRDTSKTLNPLKPIFDKKKIEAGFEIVSAFQQQAGQFLTNRALEVDALKARANNLLLSQEERNRAAIDAIALDRQWGTGGNYRRVLSAMIAATSGDVSGSTGRLVQAAAVNYLQGLGASEVKAIADALSQGREAETARAVMHTLVGCVGALGSNQDCRAGALGAGTSSVLNALLSSPSTEGLSSQEKQAHSNLISTLVSGVASVTGTEGVTAVVSARTETENNALTLGDLKSFTEKASSCEGRGDCDQVQKHFQKLSLKNRDEMISLCSQDSGQCRKKYGHFVEEVTAYRQELDVLSGMDLPKGFKTDLATYLMQHQEAISMTLSTEVAEQLQKRYGLSTEQLTQATALAMGAIGSVKGLGSTAKSILGKETTKKIENIEQTATNYFGQQRKYWNQDPIEYSGNKVYQRNDLIDLSRIDLQTGLTNKQLMQNGLAPYGTDGKKINLHHMLQAQDGPIAEVSQSFHQNNAKIIHINSGSDIPSGIDRSKFDKWKKDYWKTRFYDFD